MRSVKTLGYTPNIRRSEPGWRWPACASPCLAGKPQLQLYESVPPGAASRIATGVTVRFWFRNSLAPGAQPQPSRTLLKNGVDGVILPPPLGDSQADRGPPRSGRYSLGSCRHGRGRNWRGYPSSSTMQPQYLLSPRDIGRSAFVKGSAKQLDSAQRYEGFHKAMIQAGLEPNPGWIKLGNYTYQSGISAGAIIARSEERGPPPFSPATTTWLLR